MKAIIVCVLGLLLLASAAIAEENATTNNLNARYQHILCRAELAKAQAGILSETVESTPSEDTINANMETLKGYADAGDIKGFNNYAKTTVTSSFKTFNSKMIAARNEWKSLNMSRLQRREGLVQSISAWKDALTAFSDCNNNARRNIADVRIQQVTTAVEKWNQIIADMKAKGLTTTDMEAVVADAAELNAQLQEAQQITEDAAYNAKIEEIRQLHLHLWARFSIARIESYLQQIEPKATEAGMTEPVNQIKAMLSSSKAIAAKGNKYAEGEFEQTWQNIYQAGEKLKKLANDLKGEAQ
jgi:hypothetical protein